LHFSLTKTKAEGYIIRSGLRRSFFTFQLPWLVNQKNVLFPGFLCCERLFGMGNQDPQRCAGGNPEQA
jgi:hypothetical protein